MSKKMKTPFIFFKNKQPWKWPSCKHPKTHSFRETTNDIDPVFMTANSLFLNTSDASLETLGSYRFTTATTLSDDENSSLETIVRGVRWSDPERLFFEPGYTSSSIVKEELLVSMNDDCSSIAVAIESNNPYRDCLEELLGCYLNMNSNNNHDCIVAAFLDLLLPTSPSMEVCHSDLTSSADSCFSSRSL